MSPHIKFAMFNLKTEMNEHLISNTNMNTDILSIYINVIL